MTDKNLSLQETVNSLYQMQFSAHKEVTHIAKQAIEYIWKELVDVESPPTNWKTITAKEIYFLRLSTETYSNVHDSKIIKLAKQTELSCYWKTYGLYYTDGCDKEAIDREDTFWTTVEDYCTIILEHLGYYKDSKEV